MPVGARRLAIARAFLPSVRFRDPAGKFPRLNLVDFLGPPGAPAR